MMESLNTLKSAWLPVGPEEIRRKRLKWCYIDIETKMLTRERFSERMEFWDKISNELQNITHRKVFDDNYSKSITKNKNKDEF